MKSVLTLLLLTISAAAQQSAELERRLSEKIGAALKKSGAPSVSIAVVKDGELVYAKAFGMANIAENRAADVHTRYAVGSISKQFTATAILLLDEQGKLSLDDKVSKYFPDLTRASQVSIRQLLSHTSGYEDYAPQDYIIPEWTKPTTPQAILDRWAKKPLNFDPGTRWQYSNTNYVLAGEIFEKISGRPHRCCRLHAIRPGPGAACCTRGQRLVFRGRRALHDAVRPGALGHRISPEENFSREIV